MHSINQCVEATVESVFPFGVFVRMENQSKAYIRRRELTISGDIDPREVVMVGDTLKAVIIHHQLWEKIFALGFTTRQGGSGLGVFIARSLVEPMGGKLQVEESRIPFGTTFLVSLPITG